MRYHIATEKFKQAKHGDKKWVTLEDPHLVELILKSLGDEDKKNIINTVIDKPHVVSEILEISNIPQTSGYRKINALIDDGILVPQGHIVASGGKRVTTYKSVFDDVNILIEKNKIIVKVRLA